MGNVIQGIFTDEPGHCSGMWSVKIPDNAVTRISWWSGMEDEYSAATGGRDFKTDYQEAYANGTLAQSNVLRIWTKLRSERYRRTFFDPIRNWCNANGIISTGHLVSENNPADCARVNGSPINTLLGLSKPGIDLITTDTGHSYEWITLALAQTCARRKGICSSAELFGLGPCDISLTTIRKQYWICALHGIDTFFQGLWHRTAIRFHKKPAKSLTYAYNEIYAESEPLELAEGQHILELQGARDDKMFLPVLWMTGDFSEPRRGIITPIKQLVKCGSLIEQQLPSFAGTITYSAEVKPKPGEKLAIDSGDAVVSVKLAGRDLGLRAWAPFEWDIPSDLAGRLAKLEISVTTSVRSIFGFEDDPDACLGHAQWAVQSSQAHHQQASNRAKRFTNLRLNPSKSFLPKAKKMLPIPV